MSYEGYVEYICENGHENGADCWDDIDVCRSCGGKLKWRHSVDQTNGPLDDDPCALPAPVKDTGSEDVWHKDHHGNKYATKLHTVAPDSPVWREL